MAALDILSAVNMLVSLATMPAGDVQPEKIKSIHDVGAMVVRCYHPTGTYTGIEVVEYPWRHGAQWKAETSALLRVSYRGNYFKFNHQITIAAMQRENEFMAHVIDDSNQIPRARNCALKYWIKAN